MKKWLLQMLCDHRWYLITNHSRAAEYKCAICGKEIKLIKAHTKLINEIDKEEEV